MKHTTRWIAMMLVLVMMLTAIACGKGGENTESTTTAPQGGNEAPSGSETTETTTAATENPYDENGYLKSDLPEDLNFGGATVGVLYWNDVEHPEFEAETITGDIVNDAIYTRNLNIEEKLGVDLAFYNTKGNGSNIAAFKNFVGNAYTAGEQDYDLIASYSRTTAACAQAGYCADLLELDHLNFENPWWPSSLLDIVGIGDSIYFASGDASINVLHMMYCTLYNKDMVTEFQLQDPVELVRSGKWTIEAMQTMSKDVYQDLDNDGKKSAGDLFGTTVGSYHIDALYTGSGLKLVEQGEGNQLMVISSDFFSEKAIDLCDNLGDWLATNDVYDSTSTAAFEAGNCIFDINRCRVASYIQDTDWSYGVLPVPKYDEAQEDYVSVMGNPFTLYAVYANSKDPNRAAAVLECWASEAYRTTTPAQFETTMKLKYSESDVEAEMFDTIRSTVCFDMGRLFNPDLNNLTDIFFKAADNGNSWATISKGQKVVLGKLIDKISNAFLAQQAQ